MYLRRYSWSGQPRRAEPPPKRTERTRATTAARLRAPARSRRALSDRKHEPASLLTAVATRHQRAHLLRARLLSVAASRGRSQWHVARGSLLPYRSAPPAWPRPQQTAGPSPWQPLSLGRHCVKRARAHLRYAEPANDWSTGRARRCRPSPGGSQHSVSPRLLVASLQARGPAAGRNAPCGGPRALAHPLQSRVGKPVEQSSRSTEPAAEPRIVLSEPSPKHSRAQPSMHTAQAVHPW